MKKKRNTGFTLIELLAVIVILAVIALIATPLIMNVINDAKKGASRDAGYNVIKAGELRAATEGIAGANPPYHYDETSNLDMKGTLPSKFTLDINEDMDTQLKAWLNGYCVVKEYGNETVTIDESKKSEAECVTGGSSVTKKYENGEAIYFNPETNQKCSVSEYKPDNSLNQNKSGCMKWYAFNDSESSSTVNVILDHNTTYGVAWNSSGNNADGMKEVKTALETDVNNWHDDVKRTARLIEANEIAKITGNTEFDATNPDKDLVYWLEDSSYNEGTELPSVFPQQGEAKYKWLFDYTYGCIDYGCSIADNNTGGYWTSTPTASNSSDAWIVGSNGTLNCYIVDHAYSFGVRPVITISKSILS